MKIYRLHSCSILFSFLLIILGRGMGKLAQLLCHVRFHSVGISPPFWKTKCFAAWVIVEIIHLYFLSMYVKGLFTYLFLIPCLFLTSFWNYFCNFNHLRVFNDCFEFHVSRILVNPSSEMTKLQMFTIIGGMNF